jgi:F420-non-reducing hydrogenase small subunit
MVKVAEEWLNICGGCEVTILDIGEPLLDLLPSLEFVHIPVLADHKYHGQTGEGDPNVIEIPEADVGIISGGIRNEKEKHVAEAMREYDLVYRGCPSTEDAETPNENLPPLLDRVYAVDEVVTVDLSLPGCPTNPALIVEALTCLLEGKPFEMEERSVCDTCPTKREKKAAEGAVIKRPLDDVEFDPDDWENTRCYMEQGYLCQGPVTKAGCATKEEDGTTVPRCVKGYMTCRGCFGPIRKGANPMVDMMGALSSIGFNAREIEDRRATLNRYTGGHNMLRPLPKRPGV